MMRQVIYLIILISVTPVFAQTILVNPNGSADFTTIQAAINDANSGDTIIIMPGTYTGTENKNIDFYGKSIIVKSTDPNDPDIVDSTVIDCQNNGRGFYLHSGEDANTVIAGLKIFNSLGFGRGGGIYCQNSAAKILNCSIEQCQVDNVNSGEDYANGAGIYCSNASLIIQNCRIQNCDSWAWGIKAYGGAIYCETNSNLVIKDCDISDNEVIGDGMGKWTSCLWWRNLRCFRKFYHTRKYKY